MASVVFLRGVNVGGHKAFSPSGLAKEMAALGVVNVGAAGTFVVKKAISAAKLRTELLRRLPFAPEIMICTGAEVAALAATAPFARQPDAEAKHYVTVLPKKPAKAPKLPIRKPDGEDWQVKVFAVKERFVLSLHRRQGKQLIYPNEVVEKAFDAPATTRNWSTIAAIARLLEA